MATVMQPIELPAPARQPVPDLQNGDRLTRDEFERRYTAMGERVKAELIEGQVYLLASPVSHDFHGHPQARLIIWLGTYESYTPVVEIGDNSTVRLDLDNEPQPDALLRILPTAGGQSGIEDGYVARAPEFVAEVAASSASYDLHWKLNAYRRNGVREYIVWRVFDNEIDWFILRGSAYERLLPDAAGIHRSETFPGLWLDAAAMLAGNKVRVLEVVHEGLRSPEHAKFVAERSAK